MPRGLNRVDPLLTGPFAPLVAGLVALLAHGLFLLALPEALQVNESTDFRTFYRPVAENLAAGRGLVDAENRPAVRYPPGFPVLLAPFIGSESGLTAFAMLSIFAAGALHFAWARRATGSAALAALASLLASSYLPWLWAGKQPNSELPFAVLFFAALWAFQGALGTGPWIRRAGWVTAAGTLAGWAALVRPIALGLSIALAAALVLGRWREAPRPERKARLGLAALVVFAQLAVMAPWILTLHQHTDRWLPLSTGGRLSMLDGLTYAIDPAVHTPDALPDSVIALMETIRDERDALGQPPHILGWLARRALEDPGPVVGLLAIKAARSWYGTESLRLDRWLLLVQIPYLGLAAWGLVRLFRDRRSRQLALTILTITGLFWGMTVLVLSILRYLLPVMALLTVPMATALLAVARRFVPIAEPTP